MFYLFLVKYVSFPEKKNSIFRSQGSDSVHVESSGSLGYYYDGKCHATFPNSTLKADERLDWCSNVAKKESGGPWITYSLKNKKMKLTGYSLRNGCCRYTDCCCIDDNTFIDEASIGYCCCRLYSYEIQGSNDNRTWKTIHKVDEKNDFYYCKFETFEFQETEAFQYVRLTQTKEFPGCPFCMAINEIDFYGETTDSYGLYDDIADNDESVSIIGKIKRDE